MHVFWGTVHFSDKFSKHKTANKFWLKMGYDINTQKRNLQSKYFARMYDLLIFSIPTVVPSKDSALKVCPNLPFGFSSNSRRYHAKSSYLHGPTVSMIGLAYLSPTETPFHKALISHQCSFCQWCKARPSLCISQSKCHRFALLLQ